MTEEVAERPGWSTAPDSAWETPCPDSPDNQHCAHWYDDPEADCCYEVKT